MAKNPENRKTDELLPVTKRRGRPPTGQALTAAERKAAQRKRDREHRTLTENELESVTISGLLEHLSSSTRDGRVDDLDRITAELRRRAQIRREALAVTITDYQRQTITATPTTKTNNQNTSPTRRTRRRGS